MTPAVERYLSVSDPLHLWATLHPLGPTTATAFERGAAWRAERTPRGPATLCLRPEGQGLRLRAWGPGAAWLAREAPQRLGLGDDPGAFELGHPALDRLYRRFRGARLGRTGQVVDALVRTILGQRVTGAAAARSWRGLVRRWGEPAPGPVSLWVPPDPSRLAGIAWFHLHDLGIERARAETLLRVCRRAPHLEVLASRPAAEAGEALRRVRGVGPWTAAKVLAVTHGDPDAVPRGDYHLPDTVAWVLAREPRADDERMLELLAPWEGRRGRVIRLLKLARVKAPRFGPRRSVVDLRDR